MARLPTYNTIHRRLAAERGRPRDLKCACGKQAHVWAYQHTAKIELRDEQGCIYSADLDDYAPMCGSCHSTLDRTIDRPKREDSVLVVRPGPSQGEPLGQLRETDPEAYREARAAAGRASSRVRRKCNECPMIAHAGNMARHQRASGHIGWSTC